MENLVCFRVEVGARAGAFPTSFGMHMHGQCSSKLKSSLFCGGFLDAVL